MSRLIDLEELLKFPIRIDHYDKVNGNEHFVLGIETVLEYAENLPTIEQPKWIPVSERLPESNTSVLVADTRVDYVSFWVYAGDGLWYGGEFNTWGTEDITHWMPLPQPPKGDE